MKPCRHHRKRLACLALGELEPGQAQALGAHLETCAGCRHYLAELSRVTDALAVTANLNGAEVRASARLHQSVLRALRAGQRARVSTGWLGPLGQSWLDRRLGLAALGAAAAILAAWFWFAPRPTPVQTARIESRVLPDLSADAAPTLANYRSAAERSLQKLDDLLTRQGNRNPPAAPIYTAGTLFCAE
jgi:anti-sigma factor RsiW